MSSTIKANPTSQVALENPTASVDRARETRARGDRTSARLEKLVTSALADFPWKINFRDWTGRTYQVGGDAPHWRNQPLLIAVNSEAAARTILSLNGMGFLEKFLEGEVDLEGNLYLITQIKHYANIRLGWLQALFAMIRNRAFQSRSRAKVNVKSHYDIPQRALEIYLDKAYASYSCGIFEHPERRDLAELLRVGQGETDDFDSLEKAQWRKFKDAVDFIRPEPGENLLDIGCGYAGQLEVALENHPFGKVVGWTHSSNQARAAAERLSRFDSRRWELKEGDYREDDRVFDHITSTGMISHVGPRGLVPYVKNVRRRIKKGGRYLHHALMNAYSPVPHDADVGLVFNKKYVWPGFHWFTLGEHVRALERNGFQIRRMRNLSLHYSKTTASWYERMMDQRETMVESLGEPTVRAWQIFLAGVTESFLNKTVHVYRVYCESV